MVDGRATTIADQLASHYRELVDRARGIVRSDFDAEDAVQEVMLTVLAAPDLLTDVERLGAWLYRLVQRRCLDIIRNETRRQTREEESGIEAMLDLDPSADEQDREEIADAIAEAVNRLPEASRRTFVEHVVEGRTYRELSERDSVPQGTLMARTKRAADHIRAELEALGFADPR